MARELREIIALQEQQAAEQGEGGNQPRLKFLEVLGSMINYGKIGGHIDPELPLGKGALSSTNLPAH